MADAVEDTASAVYWTNRLGLAVYRKAQHAGMRWQNWRHKGAGDSDGTALAAAAEAPAASSGKSGKKSWSSDEESFSNTSYSETTYTRKRTR